MHYTHQQFVSFTLSHRQGKTGFVNKLYNKLLVNWTSFCHYFGGHEEKAEYEHWPILPNFIVGVFLKHEELLSITRQQKGPYTDENLPFRFTFCGWIWLFCCYWDWDPPWRFIYMNQPLAPSKVSKSFALFTAPSWLMLIRMKMMPISIRKAELHCGDL